MVLRVADVATLRASDATMRRAVAQTPPLLGNAHLIHGIEVLPHHLGVRLGAVPDEGRPAPAAYRVGQRRKRRLAGGRLERVVEQAGERHRARREPALPQRHGAHVEPGNPAGPAVGDGVLRRHGRPGENEHPSLVAHRIGGAARGVPYRGNLLPLVHDMRARALQCEARVGLDEHLDVRAVQVDGALPEGKCRPRLAAPLRPPNLDRPESVQGLTQTLVDDARAICRRLFRPILAHRDATIFTRPYCLFEENRTAFSRKSALCFRGVLRCVSKWSSIGCQRDSVCGRPRPHEEDARHRDAPAPDPLRQISGTGALPSGERPRRGAREAPHDAQ